MDSLERDCHVPPLAGRCLRMMSRYCALGARYAVLAALDGLLRRVRR